MKELKIILVDDNLSFRKAIKSLLVEQYNSRIIGEAGNADEFWKINNIYSADLILMDVMMPKVNGIELTNKILWQNKHMKVIAVTMHVDKIYLTTLIEAGFVGCIFKDDLVKSLKTTIDTVMNGRFSFPGNILIDKKYSGEAD
jgi:two-component system response regulator NreC